MAYKRFSDNIPKQIDTDFVQGIDRDVELALLSMELSEHQCTEWLQEDPADVQRREELLGKKKRLESAKARLDTVARVSFAAM